MGITHFFLYSSTLTAVTKNYHFLYNNKSCWCRLLNVKEHEDMKDSGNTFGNFVSAFVVTTDYYGTKNEFSRPITVETFYGPIIVTM